MLALTILSGCSGGEFADPELPLEPEPARSVALGPDSLPATVETVANSLSVPWDIAFLPDGRLLATERSGRVRVIEGDQLRREPWASIEVFADDPDLLPESGLMGLAVSPDFATDRHVYVAATVPRRTGRLGRLLSASDRIRSRLGDRTISPYIGRVYRFTDRNGAGVEPTIIVDNLPASWYHVGGALRFGPDGMLYLTVGDVLDSDLAQDASSPAGAILRYRPDGSVPDDNPFPGSPVLATGLRNVQGLAWTEGAELFAIDHGPSFLPHESGRFASDEFNRIEPGANYGWPVHAGSTSDSGFRNPLVEWNSTLAPAGLALYSDTLFPWSGDFLVTSLRGGQLRQLRVSAGTVTADHVLIDGRFGRLRAIAVDPDGRIYLSTSNRDGRGEPRDGGDRILRLAPALARD